MSVSPVASSPVARLSCPCLTRLVVAIVRAAVSPLYCDSWRQTELGRSGRLCSVPCSYRQIQSSWAPSYLWFRHSRATRVTANWAIKLANGSKLQPKDSELQLSVILVIRSLNVLEMLLEFWSYSTDCTFVSFLLLLPLLFSNVFLQWWRCSLENR